ncbi:MAG: PepSY domain-containing protein [Paracoccaceae bacterium]
METKPKSRFAKLMMATLAGTIALGGVAATMARAESGQKDAAAVQAPSGAKITLADAIRVAEAAGQGIVTSAEAQGTKVLSAEYGHEDGKLGIELKVADAAGKVTEVMVDGATGTVMAADQDSSNDESGEGNDGDEVGEEQEG